MDDTTVVEQVPGDPVRARRTEFVERKGIGHPDTLCDGIAEAVSRRLCRYYRAEFGRILHHNTDKVHLGAGRSEPELGGGTVQEPIYVLVGGQATTTVDGRDLPIDELATDAAQEYLLETVPELAAEHVVVETRIGQTSSDLGHLFERSRDPLANDTSVGVGHAPLSATERLVRTLEPRLYREIDAVGRDVKLMARRREDRLSLTIAAAVLDHRVDSMAAYRAVVAKVQALAERHASETVDRSVDVRVNAADGDDPSSVYLTVTGLSAENGDDGAVGRGNRVNGLITPLRLMSLEAAAGKNPVTHVGKLYNLLARQIARELDAELGGTYSGVQLCSRIGDPVREPWGVDVVTTVSDRAGVAEIVERELEDVAALTDDLIDRRVDVF